MSEELSLSEIKKEWHGTYSSYCIGFFSALLFTLLSFSLVVFKLLSGRELVIALVVLALVQAIFQLLFFLHLGQEDKPKWESFTFYFMVLVLLIIALGSLWVMYNLNDRVMVMSHD